MAAAAWRAWVAIREGDSVTADASIELSESIPARGATGRSCSAVRALRDAYPDRRAIVEPFLREMRPWATDAGIVPLGPRSTDSRARVRLADGDIEPAGILLLDGAVRGVRRTRKHDGTRHARGSTWREAHLEVGEPGSGRTANWTRRPLLEELGALDELEPPQRLRDAIASADDRRSGGLLLAFAALLRRLLVRHERGVDAGEHDVLVDEALRDVLA